MKIRREYCRVPERGPFRRIALRARGEWTGWVYYAEGRSRDGFHVTGMGSSHRAAVADLVSLRKPYLRPIPRQMAATDA